VGESPSARTERELVALRARIDDDVDAVGTRLRADLDPRALARRQPLAVLGALGSLAVAGAATIVAKARAARTRRPDEEIDRIVEQLGGRVDKMKKSARKRLRERLRKELSEVEAPKRTAGEAAWGVSLAALTAGATEMARRFAGRLAADETDERYRP
jgi:hypothetical protein